MDSKMNEFQYSKNGRFSVESQQLKWSSCPRHTEVLAQSSETTHAEEKEILEF